MKNQKQGTHRPKKGRKTKTFDGDRTCKDYGCTTILSRYNGKETCFRHCPKDYGRIRGYYVKGKRN